MSRRTTARTASAKKRYTVDAFEGIEGLQDEVSDHSPIRHTRDSDSEDEFKVDAEPEEAEDEDEDEFYDEDGEVEAGSNAASDAGEGDLDDGMLIAREDDPEGDDDDDILPIGYSRAGPRKPKVPLTGPDGALYARGLPESVTRKSGKHDKRLFLFGSSVKEFSAVQKACLEWDGQDTLPVRRKTQASVGDNFDYSYWQGRDARKREEERAWSWYFDEGGRENFSQRQTTGNLSIEEGRARIAPSTAPERAFLAGALDAPRLFKLRVGESVSLARVWQQPQREGFTPVPKNAAANKAGHLLNLGMKVKCVEWAPNQSSSSQYLAASVLPTREAPKGVAPAFTPQASHTAEVQIWKFAATEKGSVDSDTEPLLKYVLYTGWGDIKALKWCPAPHKKPPAPKRKSLGLLAGIWGDGSLRVIDLMDLPDPSSAENINIQQAAFEAHPPDTLFTCITWLSARRIAVGCANGCIAVFDLTKPSSSAFPRPVVYKSIATGYILSIAACYPSHQNLVLTTSADGYPRMTDLNEPNPSSATGTVQAPRSRSTQDITEWNDFCQTAVVMDENFALKGLPLRRFFTTVALGRARSVGTSLATSPCHPFVLMGTAHGEVTGLNPMRRLIQPKVLPLVQSWFVHEWRRPTEAELAGESSSPAGIRSHGLSRFIEGQKVEQGQRTYREGSTQKTKDKENGLHFHTVHEEPTAVSSLSWNPNREFGSWAAAGLADGLLRVEDLAAA